MSAEQPTHLCLLSPTLLSSAPPPSYGPGPEHGGDHEVAEALQSVQLAGGSGGVGLGGGPKSTERQGLINMMADSSQGRW